MGTPNILVGSAAGSAQRLFNVGSSGDFVVQNVGAVPIFLDSDSSVSQQTNEYNLLPGNTITWTSGVECWALASSNIGYVSLANAVTEYDNTSYNNGAILAQGFLGDAGIGTVIGNTTTLYNTTGYSSVRLNIKPTIPNRTGTVLSAGAFAQFIALNWSDPAVSLVGFSATQAYDQYVLTPGSPQWGGMEIVADVRGGYLALTQTALTRANAGLYTYVVRGYNTRVPPLSFEYFNPVAFSNLGLPQDKNANYTETLAAAANGQAFPLPLWSGLLAINLTQVFAGPVTTPGTGILYPVNLGINYGVVIVPTGVSGANFRAPPLDVILDRQPYIFQVRAGAGYTTMINNVSFTFHGTEDS
jgi:hypothetical protein